MALTKVMPLLISNGHPERANGKEEKSNQNGEENNISSTNNGLPPQYPNRISGKMLGNKIKTSNNYSTDHQYPIKSNDSPQSTNGGMEENYTSSSVPRRHKRRGKKPVHETSCVDSDIKHHILYGKETTL